MDASDIIALCAAAAALAAVGATVYQARLSHRHDRLTVQPFLAWSESYVQEDHGTFLTFSLTNHGQGPAIINDRWFEIDAKRFNSNLGGSDLVDEVTRTVLGDRAEWHPRHSGLPAKAVVLPAGAEFVITKLYFPRRDKEGVRAVLALCPEIDLKVEFESLYNEGKTFSALHGVKSSRP